MRIALGSLVCACSLATACGPSGRAQAVRAPIASVPAPTAPPASAATAPTAPGTGDAVGTAHPLVVEAAARNGAWVVVCEAREDTDGDGAIAVHVGMHGDTYGDRFRPYLVRGAGAGEAIDSLVGYTADGHWVVALRAGTLAVLDVRSGAWTALPGADVRDDGVPLGPHRAASVARAGAHMTYFRDDDTVVIRELATASERSIDVPGAKLWRVEVEPLGLYARVYALRKDTDGDGALTWPSVRTSLSDRDCRGPIMSYSTGGWNGDKPDELWLELATGALAATRPSGPPSEPEGVDEELGLVDGHAVIAIDAAGRRLLAPADGHREIATGPLRWVAP